jgi:hypothetical protein
MEQNATTALVEEIMLDFASLTGLAPPAAHPRRYLWTDAFAVCNYVELFRQTHDETYRDLALCLVDQVHHVLGRHRDDDPRTGWISGLSGQEGEMHPTKGGLRIGKKLPERGQNEPFNERLEWDRDGQYFHYLTKWMHALNRVSRVTGDPKYNRWAIELAKTAYARFTYLSSFGGKRRMYWKMSIDLSRPLVPSMGQHDPLDGFVTFGELQQAANAESGLPLQPGLPAEIADMAGICRGRDLLTDDPLGIGGLLSDASRIAQLMIKGGSGYAALLDSVVDAALRGTVSFMESGTLDLPAGYRLAFRELGLSIGLKGAVMLADWIEENPDIFKGDGSLQRQANALAGCIPVVETIGKFWLDKGNRNAGTWTEHREINMVMLATSLAPAGFLSI